MNCEIYVINSAVKHTWTCDLLIIDEIHVVASKLFVEIFKKVKYRGILGLTATLERLDGRETLIKKYCPVVDTIAVEEAMVNHWVSEFVEYLVVLNVDDIETYKGYNRQFTAAFEFFSFNFDLAMKCIGKDGFKFRNALRDKMFPIQSCTKQQRSDGLKAITYNAVSFTRALQNRKAFINNHPKKLEIAREIIEARKDKKIITFSNNVKMAESIGIGNVYTGKDSKKKGRETLEEFATKSTGVLNSVKKADTGFDCPGLSVAINLGIDSSKIRSTQRLGRCIRFSPNKRAEIFTLVINNTVELEWFRKSRNKQDYITIDENGLREVLTGIKPKTYTKPLEEFTFRF